MRKTKLLCWVVVLTIISIGCSLDGFHGKYIAIAQAASSQQPDEIAKEIGKELRLAEKNMFSGKNEVADKQLEKILAKLGVLKEIDPENKKIKSLNAKYERTRKAIDKKLGRNAKVASGEIKGLAKKSEVKESSGEIKGLAKKSEVKESSGEIKGLAKKSEVKESSGEIKGLAKKSEVKESSGEIKGLAKKSEGTKMLAASASQPAAQSASTEKLPYEIRQLIKEARGNVTAAEDKGKMLSQPRYAKLTLSQKTKMVDKSASMARKKLEEAKQLAAAEGITDHPDFTELTQRLAAVDVLVASDTAKADKQEKEMNSAAAAMRMDLESLKVATEAAEKKVGKYVGKIHYNKIEVAETALIAIEKFEKNDKQALLQLQKDFGEKYGTTAEEIDGYAKSVGFQNYETPSLAYLGITEFIQEIDQGRVAMAEDLATRSAKMVIGNGRHEFTIREDYQDARNWLSLGAKFAPDNALVLSEQKTIDSRIDAGLKAFYAKIDARPWPPGSAAGGSSEYQSVAKDYFVQSKAWAKREKAPYKVLDLKISGTWSVQKKDLFGSPIMYGLPVIVAVELEKDIKDNLARVFHMTLRTPESANPQTAPPFTSDTVGNSYFIRKTAIK